MRRMVGIGSIWAAVVLGAFILSLAQGQGPAPSRAGGQRVRPQPAQSRAPSGVFSDTLGTYLTIEGVLDDEQVMAVGSSNALRVDTVNGQKLATPILIAVQNVTLPREKRCVLKGYELGHMTGRPPAERDAAKEQGQDATALVKNDQRAWHWSPYFVVLIAAEPADLKITQR